MNPDISGLWPAMLTPVAADGTLDTPRALAHARHLLAQGSDGITLFGTTSEGPAFTNAERKGLLEHMIAHGIRPDQIVVTTTCSALADAIDLGQHAIAQGCMRQLFMPPFYFRQPPDAGIMASVTTVVDGIGDPRLKMLLYHIPGLSSVVFTHNSIRTLAERHPGQVIGVKDSSGSLEHGLALARAFPQLAILSGAEQYVAEIMRAGGSGSINGLANIAPALMARIIAHPDQVSPQDEQLVLDLLALLSLRPGLAFVNVYKTMLAEQTGDDAWLNVRAPLSPLESEVEQQVRTAYRAIGAALSRV
ncbi:dihydrodipicolinate synthase family protein [Comamonadaceae bacterium G21597-S1]|nr:dihydrodipicolinate synthase family protein [Comamonadaceae bacterium G21597-S1]